MKINDRFSVVPYQYGWEIHETRETINPKTKEKGTKIHKEYYPKMETVFKVLAERTVVSEDLQEMINELIQLKEDIKNMSKSMIAAAKRGE